MDSTEKLACLKEYMRFEIVGEVPHSPVGTVKKSQTGAGCISSESPMLVGGKSTQEFQPFSSTYPVYMAALPNGKRVPILKTVLTSVCEHNCNYCAFRSGRDFPRVSLQPDELAKTFVQMYRADIVQGIFLSSGVVGGGVHTQDRLIAAAEILRRRLGYQDYLHLKIMPGAERAQVEHSMQLADRVSVNLEAPTTERLIHMAPEKLFLKELMRPLQWVEEIRCIKPSHLGWKGHWPSSTTQFVVGGVNETDFELLNTTCYLHKSLHLARVYYSGFAPVPGTPMEDYTAVNPWRRHRLFQGSFLIRDYGFSIEDFRFSSSGNLALEKDPKLAWAEAHLGQTPLEINNANLQELLRIPGIGPQGARLILEARSKSPIRQIDDLKRLGIKSNRLAKFILIDGRRPEFQMSLW